MSFFLSIKTFFLSDIAFLAVFPQKHPYFFLSEILSVRFISKKRLSIRNPLLCVRFPSESFFLFCQKLPSFCHISFPEKTFFLSDISFFLLGFPQNTLLYVRNLHLSIRFPSETSFFLSEITFLPSDFPQKCPFCQKLSSFCQVYLPEKNLSVWNLLSIRFPSDTSFFLPFVRNHPFSVRFLS